MPPPPNLFDDIPAAPPGELVQALLEAPGVRVERIVSRGHASAEGFWYDQASDEWVVLLRGAARLLFEGEPPVELRPGDYVHIPARQRHRVEWTDPAGPTVWLAVHFSS